jgi:hypothetical protein
VATNLVNDFNVEVALLRPLSDSEAPFVRQLCGVASTLLRAEIPTVDARIAAFKADATSPTGIDPGLVAVVLGEVIKRHLDNPKRLSSVSKSAGPFSTTESYPAPRDGSAVTGLEVTKADVARIVGSTRSTGVRSIYPKLTPAMQPRSGWWNGQLVELDPITGEPVDPYGVGRL